MRLKIWHLSAAIMLLVCSAVAQAQVVVNADSTTDTDQGLEFLHVSNSSSMTFVAAQAGISFGGFNWRLATVNEFLEFMQNTTGAPPGPPWDGNNLDGDYLPAQAVAMMEALDGVGGTDNTNGIWVDGESFGEAQFLAHNDCCDDWHLSAGNSRGSVVPALFVRGGATPPSSSGAPPAPAAVPTLSQWGLILLSMLLLGLASASLYQRKKA